jgi:hypothetical protein
MNSVQLHNILILYTCLSFTYYYLYLWPGILASYVRIAVHSGIKMLSFSLVHIHVECLLTSLCRRKDFNCI